MFAVPHAVRTELVDDVVGGAEELTKDTLDNVNLISGLQSFFAPGPVSFGGGDIILGGGGNDQMSGGAGDDIIEGDAYLHVALTSYSAGGQIIRQINYDPNANGFDPAGLAAAVGFGFNAPVTAAGVLDPVFARLHASGALPANPGNIAHAANVDTAVFNDVFANYGNGFGLFGGNAGDPAFDGVMGLDAEGFLTINHNGVNVVVGGNPQGLAGISDGADRIRGIERLQFTDGTVAIDPYGNILSWSFSQIIDPYAALSPDGIDRFYDAVLTELLSFPASYPVMLSNQAAAAHTRSCAARTAASPCGATIPAWAGWALAFASARSIMRAPFAPMR